MRDPGEPEKSRKGGSRSRHWGAGSWSSAREPKKEWTDALERLSALSREIYRDLIYENKDFYTFFSGASPIGKLALVDIGSRPSKRVEDPDVKSLRAIPWVFAWTQNRFLLPSWYGAGSALSALIEETEGGTWTSHERCTASGRSSEPSWTSCR